MKISIIGGGNMGGAIARGLSQGSLIQANEITVIDVFEAPLKALKEFNAEINTALKDYGSIATADIIVVAVKPWLVLDTLLDIKFNMNYKKQILVSIAAGVSIEEMNKALEKKSEELTFPPLFRVVPNTAIAVLKSVTLIASGNNAGPEQEELITNIFNELGWTIPVEERMIPAGTAMTSCGIAYLFHYVRAAMLAGVEMGFYPKQAQDMIVKTMMGAASLLYASQDHPEVEVDKVTTPGGVTIKGINELEANGFTHAIIQAIKASNPSQKSEVL